MYKDYLVIIIFLLILNIFIFCLFKFLKKPKIEEERCLGYKRESKYVDLPFKIIFSLTTTPYRIDKISRTLNTLISQTVKPNYILLNTPYKFDRTGEYYKIPENLKYFDNLIVNKLEKDYGPITKLIGAIKHTPKDADTWIIVCDDDDLYLQETLRNYLSYITKNDKVVYCISGFNFIIKKDIFGEELQDVQVQYTAEDLDQVNVLEGFATFCVHRSFFDDDFEPYVDFCVSNKDCKMSDDVIISNYLAMKDIPIHNIKNNIINTHIFLNNQCTLDIGFQADALHKLALSEDDNSNQLGGHFVKYVRVLNFLKENNLLYLK